MTRRDSLACVHEPFGDAFYFGPERLSSRYENDEKAREESGFANSTYKTILERIEREGKEVRFSLHFNPPTPLFFPCVAFPLLERICQVALYASQGGLCIIYGIHTSSPKISSFPFLFACSEWHCYNMNYAVIRYRNHSRLSVSIWRGHKEYQNLPNAPAISIFFVVFAVFYQERCYCMFENSP